MVDDIPANLLALEAILEPLGHQVVRAHSGQEALKQLLSSDFAAILMDVQMPLLDGFKTAALIKEREKSRHIPIIFITAISRDNNHVWKGYEHGCVDYLLKPVDPHILRSKISVFVELYLKGEEVKRQGELLRLNEREALERQRLYELERQARKEAEATIGAREDVLEIVSHDLKSPLHAIFASTALLSRHLPPGDHGERVERYVSAIERAAERMNRLISDLLDLTRIEGSRLVIDPQLHEVAPLLTQMVDMLQPIAAQKKQRLAAAVHEPSDGESLRVYCDKERIYQALTNLVGNALKFAPEGSSVRVTASAQREAVRFIVEDEGPGIREEELPHLFDRYWQADPKNRHGSGLGLAIAKGIVAAHSGRIWVESTLGRGSSFHIELSSSTQLGS